MESETTEKKIAAKAPPLSQPMMTTKPQLPYLYRILSSTTFELDDLSDEILKREKEKQRAFELACKVQAGLVQVRHEMEMGDTPNSGEALQEFEKHVIEMSNLDSAGNKRERDGTSSGVVEDFVRAKSFWYFIKTGKLLPHTAVADYATDEEYLAGACMGMCQDLARYGMMVAINRDLYSIRVARDLCSDLIDHLLDYDFSNNYLKRRFADTEYAFRTLETIMYEVTMTAGTDESVGIWPVKKRAKLESSIDTETFNAPSEERTNLSHLKDVYDRMERRDQLRDALAKYCSKVKKACRKTILYLHNNKGGKAYQQIEIAEKTILEKIQPIVDKEAPLKAGTYNVTMEDYSEAKLFYVWMFGRERAPGDPETSALISPKEFPVSVGNPENYLMGLISMTGEIARYAMQARTERDSEKITHCLASCAAISKAVLSMERPPQGIGKKLPILKRSVGRLERFLYEMSLQSAAGGQKFISETSVIGSSSLVPMLPKLSGTHGAASSAYGAADNTAVSANMGVSNFPGLSNPNPKHGGPAVASNRRHHQVAQDDRSSSSEEGFSSSSSSSSDSHKNKRHGDGNSSGKKRGITEVVKDAIAGGKIPMTLNIQKTARPGEGTVGVPVTLTVTGSGDNRSLTLAQDTTKTASASTTPNNPNK